MEKALFSGGGRRIERLASSRKKNSAKPRGWGIKKGEKQKEGLVFGEKMLGMAAVSVCHSAEEAFRKETGGRRGEDIP